MAADAAHTNTLTVNVCYGGAEAAVTLTASDGDQQVTQDRETQTSSSAVQRPTAPTSVTVTVSGGDQQVTQDRETKTSSSAVRDLSAPKPVLNNMDQMPYELMHHIIEYLSLYQQLNVASVSSRWREVVEDCLRRRRHLSSADLPGSLTNQTLRRLLPRLPALQCVDAELGSSLDVNILSEHCPHLVEVNLRGFKVFMSSLRRLCCRCPLLEVVTMPKDCSESGVKTVIRLLPRLRSLDLDQTDVTGQCLSLLPASLERLSVAGCRRLQPATLRQVAHCSKLRDLDVSRMMGLQADHLAPVLAACTRLERLSTQYLVPPLQQCIPPAGLPALQHLDVSWSRGATDTTLQQLPHLLPGLQTLDVSSCREVMEDRLRCMDSLILEKKLTLSCLSGVADDVLQDLDSSQLAQLQLSCYRVSFTSDGLTRLVMACPSLTELKLHSHPIDLVRAAIYSLERQLPPYRDVTICVDVDILDKLPPLPPGPLRLR